MLAVIKTGGKQYLVSKGKKVEIEKLDMEVGAEVSFDVLYVGDEKTAIVGTPLVEGATVTGRVIDQARHDKVVGVKHKPKKRYHMKFGHRQPYTEVEIVKIGMEAPKAAAKPKAE
jgi:large subunit ribosomal protein L21